MIRYLAFEDIVRINERVTGAQGLLRDRDRVEAAVARPYSGFGGVELFPSLWSKAAVLLHGLCRTQGFQDGDKRTAWLAAVQFLRVNGGDVVDVPPIAGEAFVLSVSAGLLTVERATEWLQVHGRSFRYGPVRDARLEYFLVAAQAHHDGADGTFSASHIGQAGFLVPSLPVAFGLYAVSRVHWTELDVGRTHVCRTALVGTESGEVCGIVDVDLDEPARISGHAHQPGGLIPVIVVVGLRAQVRSVGRYLLQQSIDGHVVAEAPVRVDLMGADPTS